MSLAAAALPLTLGDQDNEPQHSLLHALPVNKHDPSAIPHDGTSISVHLPAVKPPQK
jgi:hypothetical protein